MSDEEVEEVEDDAVEPEQYEHSAFARPRTQGQFLWNNNPLEDRHIDYE